MKQLTRAELIEQAINSFHEKQQELQQAKDALSRADARMINATNELGRLLIPRQLKQSERYNYFFEDKLYQAQRFEQPGAPDFDIVVVKCEDEK